MEIIAEHTPTNKNFIPLELACKYYKFWDCEVELKEKENIYFKCLEGDGEI